MAKAFNISTSTPEELIKAVNDAGGQRAFARKFDIPRTTVQDALKKAHIHKFRERPIQDARTENVTGIRRFILSSAQDSTAIHEPFLQQLEAYRDWLSLDAPCEIMIAGYTYNKGLFEDHSKRAPLWPSRIREFMQWERVRIGDKVDFCAEMNTRPTAENPLSGFETYTRHRWGIFPHAKVQLKSIPTMRDQPAKMIMTTGSISRPNYVPLRAGIKAQFHHVIGAVLVEIDEEGTFFCRHLLAEEDGSFHDLDRRVSNGVVTTDNRIAAVNWGDLHVAQIDPVASMVSFGIYPTEVLDDADHREWNHTNADTIIDRLKPHYQFFHDVSDFRARNHHNAKDPHLQFRLYVGKKETVESELREVAYFMNATRRDFCETIVVNSNHDEAIVRWLREADYRLDPANAMFFLKCQLSVYQAIERGDDSFSVFENVIKKAFPFDNDDVQFLKVDESFRVFDIEKGMHGHLGANGGAGSLHAFTKMGSKATVGHSHSTGILDGIWQTGTTSKLFLGYNTGLSSWTHSHVITHTNQKRQIITIQNGKWRL